jgi:hypothetical protein
VLRTIFGAKTEKVTGDWRRLRNEELHNLYTSLSDQVEKDEMNRTCNIHGTD